MCGGMHAKVTSTENNFVVAVVCAVVNCFFWPGAGTAAAGLVAGGEYRTAGLCIGLFQFLLIEILVGYIWAIYTSYKQVMCSKKE